jgi:hypothetical protein
LRAYNTTPVVHHLHNLQPITGARAARKAHRFGRPGRSKVLGIPDLAKNRGVSLRWLTTDSGYWRFTPYIYREREIIFIYIVYSIYLFIIYLLSIYYLSIL